MTKRKILVIAEGQADKKLAAKLFALFVQDKFEVYCFKTSIYQLYDYYESFGCQYEDLDIKLVLSEWCKKNHRKVELNVLNYDYTQILLVFDLDPQDPSYDAEKIKKLMNHFNDSSTYGRLYVNYPMLESFRHINPQSLRCLQPDLNFTQSKFLLSNLSHYKQDVGDTGFSIGSVEEQKQEHQRRIAYAVQQHLDKISRLIKQSCSDILEKPSCLVILLDLQVREIKKNRQGYIVSTFPLVIPELYPNQYRTSLPDSNIVANNQW